MKGGRLEAEAGSTGVGGSHGVPKGPPAPPPNQSLTLGELGRRVCGQGSWGGEAEWGKQEEESGQIFIMLSPQAQGTGGHTAAERCSFEFN